MKLIFKGSLITISLIICLILSLGFVSASNDLNELNDINSISYDNNLIADDFNNLKNNNDFDNLVMDYNPDDMDDSDYLNEVLNKNNDFAKQKSLNGNNFTDIQDLIDSANENDTVTISGNYYGNTRININKTVSLSGGADGACLDGMFSTQILNVNAPNVVISNIRFINSYDMSVSLTKDNITVINCSFENSINGELGSALSCYGNNIQILNSSFLNNIANKSSCHHTDGPAIYLIGNYAIIDNCIFVNNSGYNYETASSGGAVWLKGYSCSLTNSVFINNSATSKYGWTLHSEEQTYLAEGNGGSLYWVGNRGRIVNCSFINSIAHAYAGAIYFKAADGCSIVNSVFMNNFAVADAGAIFLGQNVYNLEINNSHFFNNTAQGLIGVVTSYDAFGGAIYATKFVENLHIFNSSFSDNYGLGTIYYKGSNLVVENSIIEGFSRTIENSTFDESSKELVIFTNGTVNNNFWGRNFNSSHEIMESEIIRLNGEYVAPESWINIKFEDLGFFSETSDSLSVSFIKLNDTGAGDLIDSLPDYRLKVKKSISDNLITVIEENDTCLSFDNYIDFYIMDNNANLTYQFNEYGFETLKLYNGIDKFISSKSIELGVIYVNDTGNDTKDIQNAIDSVNETYVISLLDKNYIIDTVNINRNVCITGKGLASISSLNGNPLFNIVSKENNTDLTKVIISDINFMVNNGDVLVLANGANDTDDYMIDIPNVLITNNRIMGLNEDVVAESVTVLKLISPRRILAITGTVSINDNIMESGVNPFIFEIESLYNGSDVVVLNGSIVKAKSQSKIVANDMTTATVYSGDGKIGKYFVIKLTDAGSNPLAKKQLIIQFNGETLYKTTDENGSVKIQINLATKGTYYMSICFLGDDDYNASFKVAKVNVNVQKANLKVTNKKYKLSSAKKALTAKFLTANNKPIKNKKIIFTINKKTYTAKTNSKGIATVKIKFTKKKTYSFTAKFSGDSTFKAVSAKGKVVIK